MSEELRRLNGTLLEQRFPGLLEKLDGPSEGGSPQLRVEMSPKSLPSLRADGLWVHSRFDPAKEAEKLAELAAGDGPLVAFGFGLGYAVEAAAKANADRAIIVVEKEPSVLRLALETRDLRAILTRERLAFVVGGAVGGLPDDVLAALDSFGGRPSVLSNRPLRSIGSDWYDKAERAVQEWASKDSVNSATLKRFGSRWVRNLVSNLDAIIDLPGIAALTDCCRGFPALLVAAGPSLDEALPNLGEISKRCVVITVDTALRAVLETGVDPDFVVVVDPQYWNARHLDRCPAPRSALITESAVYPSVLRAPFSRRFLCSSLFPLGRFVEDAVDPKGELGAGGSVSTSAWDFARIIGARPLWVAGLDLSFPGLKTHFKGALFEERTHAEALKTNSGELRSFKALRDGFPFYAEAARDGAVLTDKRLSLYAAWFSRRFRFFPEAAPFSLSERGLRIDGMDIRPVGQLKELPERRAEIDARLASVFSSIDRRFLKNDERRRREKAFSQRLGVLKGALDELEAFSTSAAETSRAALRVRGGVEKTLETLDRVNERIAGSKAKEVAGFLFPPAETLEKEISADPSDPLARHLDFSRLLYEKLAESARFHRNLLEKMKKE